MKWIPLLSILVLGGCVNSAPPAATKTPSSPPPLPPTGRALIAPEATTAIAPAKQVDRYIKLDYPTNANNFLWQLHESTDKKAWYQIAPKLTDTPRPWTWSNQLWWVGGPGTNTYTVYMSNQPIKFWRLYGVQP